MWSLSLRVLDPYKALMEYYEKQKEKNQNDKGTVL